MKKILCLLLLTTMYLPTVAQNGYKPERHIYLWDVTLSMIGWHTNPDTGKPQYYPDENIHEKVVKFIINDIKSKNMDSDSKIIVCPFRVGGVMDKQEVNVTNEGKNQIIDYVSDFNMGDPKDGKNWTTTDIVSAIDYAQKNLIDSSAINYLMILSDGDHSKAHGGDEALIAKIKDWKLFAKMNNAYAFYLMIEYENANISKQNGPHIVITTIDADDVTKFVQLNPGNMRKTVKDATTDKKVTLKLNPNVKEGINSQLSLKVTLNDTRGILKNTSMELPVAFGGSSTGDVEIPLEFNYPYEELRNQILTPDEEFTIPVHIQLFNANNDKKEFINLIEENVKLILVNKVEKNVTIRLKKK